MSVASVNETTDFFPQATVSIIAANVIVFILTFFGALDRALPFLIATPQNLLNGNFFCLLTSGFIHQDIGHLAWNMFGVFVFGRIVERNFSRNHTWGIYLGALALSMFLSLLIYAVLRQEVVILGASGALMGLIGCAMMLEPFTITFEMLIPLPVMLKGWLFIYADVGGFLEGEADHISHLAHLCGFVSVGLLVYYLNREERHRMAQGLWINIFSFSAFLLEQLLRRK